MEKPNYQDGFFYCLYRLDKLIKMVYKTPMNNKKLEAKLFETFPKETKAEYTKHLIDQYKLYIESTERNSDRRLETNKFFLTINTAVIAAFGFVEIKYSGQLMFLMILGGIAGAVISYYWFLILESYKGVHKGKFKVIHMMEEKLPLSLYATEWDIVGRGEDNKKYRPFTHIEMKMPILFMAVYAVMLVAIIPWSTVLSYVQAL